MYASTNGENPSVAALAVMESLFADFALKESDLLTLRKRTKAEGMSFLTKTLPALGKALDLALGDGVFKLPSAFKRRWRGSEIPAFCGSLFSSVFERSGKLRSDACAVSILMLRHLCFAFYKYTLPFDDKETDRVLQDFIDEDNELPAVKTSLVTVLARRLTTKVFSSFDKSLITPNHGPGVVSNHPQAGKTEFYPPNSPVVEHFGRRVFNHPEEMQLVGCLQFIRAFAGTFADCGDSTLHEAYKPIAKVVLVPKDSRGPRIISCEPLEHQYIQQGIRKWTQRRLETHPLSSGHVNFADQTVNRDLALTHSLTREYSTLDLKSASDRVSLELVQYLYGSSSKYLASLLACRSTHTEIEKTSGDVCHELRKFAPMGSAVCFTTLAWVVYALSVSSLLVKGLTLADAKASVYVYGDDLVIRTDLAGTVIDALEFHGLKVNVNKSFIDSEFLESCGMDAFRGNCVTPIRIKEILIKTTKCKTRRERDALLLDPDVSRQIVKTIAAAGEYQLGGCLRTAELLYSKVESLLGLTLPYGTSFSPFLCRIVATTEEAWMMNESMRLERSSGKGPFIFALTKRPEKSSFPESGYGRLRRTLNQLGSSVLDPNKLPEWGESDKPRSYSLRARKLYRWYDTAYGR